MSMYCPKCGSPVPAGHGSCFDCGATVSKGERDPWDRSDTISRRRPRPEKDRCSATPSGARSQARVTKNNDWQSRFHAKEEVPSRFGQARVEQARSTLRKNDTRINYRQPREEREKPMTSVDLKNKGGAKVIGTIVVLVILFLLELLG